jgi:hypothetical protein
LAYGVSIESITGGVEIMKFIRRLGIRIVRFLFNPRLWVNVAMLMLILSAVATANPNRLSWGFYLLLPLYSGYLFLLPFTWGWVSVIITGIAYFIIGIAIRRHQHRVKAWLADANHILLGETGWSRWAMFWLWILAYLIVTHIYVAPIVSSIEKIISASGAF